MKIQTTIMLGRDERHIIRWVEEACNLVGWHRDKEHDWPNTKDMTNDEKRTFDEIKSVRRIRSDQFAMEDVERAERYIKRKAAELMTRADEGGVFGDPALDAIFSDGVRASTSLALRRWDGFRDQLHEFIQDYHAKAA